jgi:hypothetical protein
MNHTHHCHCDHELKFCSHCDLVYCEKCTAEWKKPTYNNTWTYGTGLTLCGNGGGDTTINPNTLSTLTHTHDPNSEMK